MPWQDNPAWDAALEAAADVVIADAGFAYRPHEVVVPAPVWDAPRNAAEDTVRGQLGDAGARPITGRSTRAGRKGEIARGLDLQLVELPADVDVATLIDGGRNDLGVGIAYHHVVTANPQRHGGYAKPKPLGHESSPVPVPSDTGAGITIAVLDTGMPSPPKVAVEPFVPDDIEPGLAAPATGADPLAVGHGTMVAGVIARNAPGAAIVNRRVLLGAEGVADELDVALALDELGAGVQIVNASFGGRAASADAMIAFRAAVERAQARDMLIVASAGNEGESAAHYIAAFTGVVGVAAVRERTAWELQPFSNRGGWVDAGAVGEDVETVDQDGEPVLCSGTSFAAPLVAARIAAKAGADGTGARAAADALLADRARPLVPGAGRLVV